MLRLSALNVQEAPLSPRHPRDAQCQLKCPTVVRITQTDRVLA